MSMEYKLKCELRGHNDYVRGISVRNDEKVATSSKDGTIRIWSLDPSDKRNYTLSKIFAGHTSSVGPLAWIPPTVEYPEGRFVSSTDTLVFVWNLTDGNLIHILEGHKMQVTGVIIDNGDIVSSSYDQTLIRWRNGELVKSWKAHNSPIKSLIRLPSGELVSGSSDPTLNLKLWNGNTMLRTFQGHTDTVRGLAVIPDSGRFLSASLDGSIRLWDPQNGKVLFEKVGEQSVGVDNVGDILASIIHSVDAHASGLIVSGSEDGYVHIWKDGVYRQTLEHPGCVSDVKFLESGDIVTACSDGVVRVWTVRHDLIAHRNEITAYDSQLSRFKSNTGDQRDVYVLWDFENVHVPVTFNPFLIRKRIRRALIELGFVGEYFKIDCVVGIEERVSNRVAAGLRATKIHIQAAGDRKRNAADKYLRRLLRQWLHEVPYSGVVIIISSDAHMAKCVRDARNRGSSSVVFANEHHRGRELVDWADVAVTWQSVLHGKYLKHLKDRSRHIRRR